MSLQDQRTINHILFPFQNVAFPDNNSQNILTKRKTITICFILLYIVQISLNIHIFISFNESVCDKITSKSKWQYKRKEKNIIIQKTLPLCMIFGNLKVGKPM